MSITLGVPAESVAGEHRVALVPEVASRLIKQGMDVVLEQGAGEQAFYADNAYAGVGVQVGSREDAFGADIVLKVQAPSEAEIALMRPEATYIGFLSPLDHPELSAKLAERGVTALAMELVPRISRAQKMDALSAMSSIGGYKAVLVAADILPKFFPLLTTAAGTVKPANVLVLGAGVAGLQAIATARRLGARVSGYDIRDVVREEIESLGATFVELPLDVSGTQDEGGYAKALAEEKQRRQVELLVPFLAKSDVVISTALIPGRPAPLLVSEEAVTAMGPGSVIIDMAAANGGNCARTVKGETVTFDGVTIVGHPNLPAEMPVHASQMYARTLMAMVMEFFKDGAFTLDFDDEIASGSCVTRGGEVVHERVQRALAS